jgi:hypothetical protein
LGLDGEGVAETTLCVNLPGVTDRDLTLPMPLSFHGEFSSTDRVTGPFLLLFFFESSEETIVATDGLVGVDTSTGASIFPSSKPFAKLKTDFLADMAASNDLFKSLRWLPLSDRLNSPTELLIAFFSAELLGNGQLRILASSAGSVDFPDDDPSVILPNNSTTLSCQSV